MSTAADGLARQRQGFRGYVVMWDDCAQVCCLAPGCPAVLTCEDPDRVPEVASLAGWGAVLDGVLPVYCCGGHR